MRKCEDCKIILDNDVKHCPKCGKEIAPDAAPAPATAPDPLMDVTRLLAAASLHKFRSEWDEALATATDALRLEPRNPSVTHALGSIYEERGMLEEALVWYQMTLELDENNKQGKAGQDRVGMLMSARRKAAAAAPPKDPNRRAKLYAIGIGAAIVLVLAVVITSLALRGGQPKTEAAKPSGKRNLSPSISQPWANRTAKPSASRPSVPPLSGPTTSTRAQGTLSSLRTKAEQTIRDGLVSAEPVTRTGATIDDVIADPRASVATVTFSLPLRGTVTKEHISRAAIEISRRTFELHPAVRYVTTRCIIQTPAAEGSQVAFVGDIAREAFTPTATEQQLTAAFNHPWWNPQIGARQ